MGNYIEKSENSPVGNWDKSISRKVKGMLVSEMRLSELLDDIREREKRLCDMNLDELTREEAQFVLDYAQEIRILHRANDALEFVLAGTPILVNMDNGAERVESLLEKPDLLHHLCVLTNKYDREYLADVGRESFAAERSSLCKADVIGKLNALCAMDSFRQAINERVIPSEDITVAMLCDSIEQVERVMKSFDIDRDSITSQTLDEVSRQYNKGGLHFICEEKVEREQVKREGLEIVESNDGYVMNTNASPEMISEMPELENEYSAAVRNGNEVIHSEPPRETTIDLAEVGGNVRLEQFDDIGTVEKGQGIPTYEERVEQSEKVEVEQGRGKTTVTTTRTTQYHRDEYIER